jgi:Helix-turn-helix of DDE superfamily endonuclease
LRANATAGLSTEQFDELVARIEEGVVWDSGIGRPRQLTLRQAVKVTIMYFKTNVSEELIGELLFVDQSTISRAISDLEGIIGEVLEEFVPDLAEEMDGRVGVVKRASSARRKAAGDATVPASTVLTSRAKAIAARPANSR